MSIPVLSPLDMGSQQIHSVLDPSSAQDAATKAYVDGHSGLWTTVNKTGDYTAGNYEEVICDATSGNIIITLPAVGVNKRVSVKKTDSSAHTVTVTPASGTIEGSSTLVIDQQGDCAEVSSDATNWWVV